MASPLRAMASHSTLDNLRQRHASLGWNANDLDWRRRGDAMRRPEFVRVPQCCFITNLSLLPSIDSEAIVAFFAMDGGKTLFAFAAQQSKPFFAF